MHIWLILNDDSIQTFFFKIMLEPSTHTHKARSKNIPRMMDAKLLSSSSLKIKVVGVCF